MLDFDFQNIFYDNLFFKFYNLKSSYSTKSYTIN